MVEDVALGDEMPPLHHLGCILLHGDLILHVQVLLLALHTDRHVFLPQPVKLQEVSLIEHPIHVQQPELVHQLQEISPL